MHSYLRAIGFSEISKHQWKEILSNVIDDGDEKYIIEKDDQSVFAELSKSYGLDIGITVCGEYDENNNFIMEYAFPYFRGTKISTTEDVYVERKLEKESYSGACEDMRLGVTMIFYLANAGRYLEENYKSSLESLPSTLALSGLSLDGKILLPIKKDPIEVEAERERRNKRTELLADTELGEAEVWEQITKHDFEELNMIHRRVAENDILTVVDTYFIPYGMECDRYHILGEITEVTETQNKYTGDKLYQMSLNCNDLEFDVCINAKDLLGEPKVGRRFKGVIWAQGNLHFSDNLYSI